MSITTTRPVDTKKMAELLGVGKATLDKQRVKAPEIGPPFFRIGRRVLYPMDGPNGFHAWMAARMQGGASANG